VLLWVIIVTGVNKNYLGVDHITMTPRRERERERKTNEIIDSAETEFFMNGFDKTTMDTIAARLDLTKPALYRYFNNKHDLYYAVILRGSTILSKMMKKEVNSKGTGLEKIYATGIAYCKFYRKYPDYCRLMLDVKPNSSKNVNDLNIQKQSEFNHDQLNIMCDAIETGKTDRSIRTDINTCLTALFLLESTVAIMKLSDNMVETDTAKNREDLIMHSLMLMGNSIESNKERLNENSCTEWKPQGT